MSTASTLETTTQDYKVADINLAAWGRKELQIAETENAGFDGSPR